MSQQKTQQRRKQVVEVLGVRAMDIDELCDLFNVSRTTVANDLRILHEEGAVYIESYKPAAT